MFQINWKIKVIIYKILLILKAKKFLFFIQKNITKRAAVKIKNININWNYHLKQIKQHKCNSIFEFGAGKSLEQNIFLSYNSEGKLNQTVIDQSNMLDIKYFNNANEQISKILNLKKKDKAKKNKDIKEIYNIEYIAPCSIEEVYKKNYTFDACISTATLEHLPKKDLEKIFQNLKKIIKKDGIISSLIDYSDHYSHTDKNIGPLNFLKFSSKDWAKYNNNYLFQNRLRHQDFRKFFLDMNFEIIEEKKSSLGSPPKKISDEFEKNNDETFILWGQFVLKNI